MIALTENTIKKIDKVVSKAIDVPAEVVAISGEMGEKTLKSAGIDTSNIIINNIRRNILADPTKLSREQNMKDWATGMTAGSLALSIPAVIQGTMDPLTAGAVALGNTVKGATIGAALTGGKDTLLKSVLIPAGTTAIMTPLMNDVGEYFGVADADAMPEARVGAAGALGGGLWAIRNRGKKKLWY